MESVPRRSRSSRRLSGCRPQTTLSTLPAAASTVLYALCELAGASEERIWQLMLAGAMLLSVFAAIHTHTVLSIPIVGWSYIQPFGGGTRFVALQAIGWIMFGVALASGLCMFASGAFLGWLVGLVQFAAQVVLLTSLTQFEPTVVRIWSFRGQVTEWIEEGVPLTIVACVGGMGAFLVVASISVSQTPSACIGWALFVLLLVAQAVGLHTMWTLTWNILTLVALLLEWETGLAVAACIGFANVCLPWYLSRVVFWSFDFPGRALKGLCGWFSDEVLGITGIYPCDVAPRICRAGFLSMDFALHALPGMMLFQRCAAVVTPACVLVSFVVSMTWAITLSLHHVALDWSAFFDGRVKFFRWGQTTYFAPSKVAHIYQFENQHFQDDSFKKAVPGFCGLFLMGNVLMLLVALHPDASALIFAFGGGGLVSISALAVASLASFALGCVLCGTALGKAVWLGMKLKAA